MRVVFDTNTLISALLFRGYSSFLVELWQNNELIVLVSYDSVSEFLKVLSYPKFNLSALRINRSALFICPALNG